MKKSVAPLSSKEIQHLAQLSELVVDSHEEKDLADRLSKTLEYVTNLDEVDTKNVKVTTGITGQTNVFADDVVDTSRMLSVDKALEGASMKKKPYFVARKVL